MLKQETLPTTSTDSSCLLTASTLPNSPSKLWILSSLLKIQHVLVADPQSNDQNSLLTAYTKEEAQGRDLNNFILHTLKSRTLATSLFASRTLTQCKNDALAMITLATPLEFRYIDHSQSLLQASHATPIDDDIAIFILSVLRVQLETDLMLRQDDEKQPSLLKRRRDCFIPLYGVISTHCKLMCHSSKPHVKLWQMLNGDPSSTDSNSGN